MTMDVKRCEAFLGLHFSQLFRVFCPRCLSHGGVKRTLLVDPIIVVDRTVLLSIVLLILVGGRAVLLVVSILLLSELLLSVGKACVRPLLQLPRHFAAKESVSDLANDDNNIKNDTSSNYKFIHSARGIPTSPEKKYEACSCQSRSSGRKILCLNVGFRLPHEVKSEERNQVDDDSRNAEP